MDEQHPVPMTGGGRGWKKRGLGSPIRYRHVSKRSAWRRNGRVNGVLRELYEGGSRRAALFRYGLLAFDVTTLFYLVIVSFFEASKSLELIDTGIGLIILLDFIA